ncbi:UNVERIFIED_CONTAM: Dynamin-2B [Sesamum radiatum]|uniref:Dynamin-2B n=1 Tax=Sesamum radiatum TaxID=300843 RepID=A0AAW2SGG4_SESRA
MRQASALLADEDVDETSSSATSRRTSTFLNVVALGNTGSFILVKVAAGSDGQKVKFFPRNNMCGYAFQMGTFSLAFFPTGEGGATRAPIVIDLTRDDSLSSKSIVLQIDSALRHSLQDRLSKISGKSRDEIYLKLRTSTAPPLKLIDLPGVDKGNLDDSLSQYAERSDAILLVVIPASQAPEVASAKAIRIAKELDGECTRTVGIISKIDQASSEPKVLTAVQALLLSQGPRSTADIPWVALIGQSVSIATAQSGTVGTDSSLETAWRAEILYTKEEQLEFIHGISRCSSLELNSASWALMLESFERIMQSFLGKAKTEGILVGNVAVIKATKQCLESLRCLFGLHQAAASLSENEQLLNFVLQVVGCLQGESIYSYYLSDKQTLSEGLWEVLIVAFGMIGEVYSRVGSSLPFDIWQSTIEVLRKVMDIWASRSLLEENIISRFYIELLHCLHLVLAEPRGYLEDHVAGFVAALRNFFRYGLVNKCHVVDQATNGNKEVGPTSQKPCFEVANRSQSAPYRPPHLRKKAVHNEQRKDECPISPKQEFMSSDSECSDNDGSVKDSCGHQFAKARLAAILCIQDLCRADPKLFTAQWTMVLPSSDVLQHRKYETTLMSCLLFDPRLKVRIAAGSTIMAMLDGPASISLQIAEFKGHTRCGSFTPLSISLGHILMQLHSGTLYLIKHETNGRLLALSFKILMLLISSTPYSRMSTELLSVVISSVQSTVDEGFPFQSDRSSLLAAAINCLTAALSVSPSSASVKNMLLGEMSTGSLEGRQRSGVLYTLIRYSEQLSSPSISLEAFQALKALAHNYPNVIALCWERISSIVYGILSSFSDVPLRLWRGNVEHTFPPIKERIITAAIKVLDECLRAISGFKGTEDLSNDKFLDSPFTSDYVKTKAISSAPLNGLESPASTEYESKAYLLGSERWTEATDKHLPITIKHSSAMIDAALNDEVPSVRSAACRAIGVIACFPQIYHSPEVLEKFIRAAEHNTLDSLVSVRITASWALANICDALGHFIDALHAGRDSRISSEVISLLVDSSLRLARDNDKVKANAVRALGNLSRFIKFTSQPLVHGDSMDGMPYDGAESSNDYMKERSDSFTSTSLGRFDWLEQMVQTFLSCVTTGNVKVQWNVCHALSNLFLNKTLKLRDMDWASPVFSILLLLLRDSSNFKIRIQAAAALAVPETIRGYGKSYFDVVKSVEHVVENFKSDQISEPSNFKYWIALENQLTSTMLHLLGLAARYDHGAIQDFLIKKASFLELWIKDLCSSLGSTSNSHDEVKHLVSVDQKKDVIFRTIQSLIEVYECASDHVLAQRFDRLANSVR